MNAKTVDTSRLASRHVQPLGQLQFTLLAMLLLACIAAHSAWLSPWLLGFLAVVIGVRLWWQRRSTRLLSQWVRLPLFVLTLSLVYTTTGSPLGRDGGAALLIALAVLKLVESQNIRDGRMLIAAVFFIAMTEFLFSQDLLVTLWIGLVSVAAFACLTLLRKYPDPNLATTSSLSTVKNAFRGIGRIALAALPLAAVLFLFFPRLGQPLWGAPWNAAQSRSGISDEMSPGMISKLWLDDTPVFRVSFEGAVPAARDLYWRGPVLWNFDGQTWTGAQWNKGSQGVAMTYTPDSIVRYEVLLEATERNWYFPLDLPLFSAPDARLLDDGQMITRRPIITPRRMQLQSALRFNFDADAAKAHLIAGTRLPAGNNPRAYALAQQWRREGKDDDAVIKAALSLFHERFSYSLEPPPLAPGRAVDDFLFETQIGYCEHFASSFAYLMRAAGIPARVVTGYMGGYFNDGGNYLLVRNSDAHAWTELWRAGRGWVRVDPTSAVAPERIDRGSVSRGVPGAERWYEGGWSAPWIDRVDRVTRWWRQRVVDFDAERQRNLLTPFGIRNADIRELVIALAIGGGMMLAAGMWWTLRGTQRRLRDPLLRAWRGFCRRLERVGVKRDPHEGPIDFSRRAARALPHDAGRLLALGKEFAERRYQHVAEDIARRKDPLVSALRAYRPKRRG